MVRNANDSICDRFSNSAGAGVRHSQELYLHSGAINGRPNTQGCQDPSIMGLQDRKEEGLAGQRWHHNGSRLETHKPPNTETFHFRNAWLEV